MRIICTHVYKICLVNRHIIFSEQVKIEQTDEKSYIVICDIFAANKNKFLLDLSF